MTRSSKYVGLDVHQATTVSTVRDDAGRVLARTVVPTEAEALREFFRGMRGPIHVALEEGTQAQMVARSPRAGGPSGRGLRSTRQESAGEQRRSAGRGRVIRSLTLRSAPRGVSRDRRPGDAEGAGAHVYESGRGQHAGHATIESVVPSPRNSHVRAKRVSTRAAGRLAPAAARRRRALSRDRVVPGARAAAGAAAERESRDADGGEAGFGLARLTHDSLSRAGAGGDVAGNGADAVAVSNEAESVGVCGPRGRDAHDGRV